MHRLSICLLAGLLPGVAMAEEVGVPAGCEVSATVLRANCEMHQVLTCEGEDATRIDVYLDGTFEGEQVYAGPAMVRWRRGKLLQEMRMTEGDFLDAPMMAGDGTMTLASERVRRQLGSDAAPMVDAFTHEITPAGTGTRELAGGGSREVRRFREVTRSAGEEGRDVTIDYDPALGMPVWMEGEVIAHDGSRHAVSSGIAAVYLPGADGYMQSVAPDGAACSPG